jgi:hypothetical protein
MIFLLVSDVVIVRDRHFSKPSLRIHLAGSYPFGICRYKQQKETHGLSAFG